MELGPIYMAWCIPGLNFNTMEQPKYKIGDTFWRMCKNRPQELVIFEVFAGQTYEWGQPILDYVYRLVPNNEDFEVTGLAANWAVITEAADCVTITASHSLFPTKQALIESL